MSRKIIKMLSLLISFLMFTNNLFAQVAYNNVHSKNNGQIVQQGMYYTFPTFDANPLNEKSYFDNIPNFINPEIKKEIKNFKIIVESNKADIKYVWQKARELEQTRKHQSVKKEIVGIPYKLKDNVVCSTKKGFFSFMSFCLNPTANPKNPMTKIMISAHRNILSEIEEIEKQTDEYITELAKSEELIAMEKLVSSEEFQLKLEKINEVYIGALNLLSKPNNKKETLVALIILEEIGKQDNGLTEPISAALKEVGYKTTNENLAILYKGCRKNIEQYVYTKEENVNHFVETSFTPAIYEALVMTALVAGSFALLPGKKIKTGIRATQTIGSGIQLSGEMQILMSAFVTLGGLSGINQIIESLENNPEKARKLSHEAELLLEGVNPVMRIGIESYLGGVFEFGIIHENLKPHYVNIVAVVIIMTIAAISTRNTVELRKVKGFNKNYRNRSYIAILIGASWKLILIGTAVNAVIQVQKSNVKHASQEKYIDEIKKLRVEVDSLKSEMSEQNELLKEIFKQKSDSATYNEFQY